MAALEVSHFGFVAGFPVFLVGLASAIVCMLLSGKPMREAEAAMLKGVSLIATPIVATIGFLFMSTVIKQVGLVQTMSDAVGPVLSVAPVLILFGVAFLTGFLTQSYAASVSVLVPFLQVVLFCRPVRIRSLPASPPLPALRSFSTS